jgi:predicted dehydrogenase
VRLAVLGLGSAGRRHAENLLSLGHEVVGWDPQRGSDLPDVGRADSLEEALASAAAVVVASPSSAHAEQARAALEAGRDVLVEKPLATNAADAEALAVLAERTGRTCGVAMNLRFHPAVRRLRELVSERALGKPLLASAWFGYDLRRWRPGSDYRGSYSARAELGGGIVLDAIHELDYLLSLLGPVAEVGARVARLSDLEVDVEDVAVCWLRFRSGALASVDLNFFEPAYRRGCLIAGSDATARWDWNLGTITVFSSGGSEELDVRYDVSESYRASAADFVDALESGRPPEATAAEGVAALRVADAIKQSAAAGGHALEIR